jgi:hypothetical protein
MELRFEPTRRATQVDVLVEPREYALDGRHRVVDVFRVRHHAVAQIAVRLDMGETQAEALVEFEQGWLEREVMREHEGHVRSLKLGQLQRQVPRAAPLSLLVLKAALRYRRTAAIEPSGYEVDCIWK